MIDEILMLELLSDCKKMFYSIRFELNIFWRTLTCPLQNGITFFLAVVVAEL